MSSIEEEEKNTNYKPPHKIVGASVSVYIWNY